MVAKRQGSIKKAASRLTEALRHNPGHTKSKFQLGLIMSEMGRPKLAVSQFESILQTNADDADAHFELGKALAAEGQTKAAVAHLKEASWLRPDWEAARKQLEQIEQP